MCKCQLQLFAIVATMTNILIKVIIRIMTNSVRVVYPCALVDIVRYSKSRKTVDAG